MWSMDTIDRPKPRKRFPRRKKTTNKYTFSEVISATVDEIDKAYGMLIYKHPTNLSPEQVLFCLELIGNGYDMQRAVQTVYGSAVADLSDNKCLSLGKKLMKLRKVRHFIEEQLHLRAEKLQSTADWVASQYKQWSQIDLTDYLKLDYSEKGKAFVRLKCDIEDMPKVVRSAIKKIRVDAQGGLTIEFIDQKQALDSLARMLGYIDNKVTVEAKAPIMLSFDRQDEEA